MPCYTARIYSQPAKLYTLLSLLLKNSDETKKEEFVKEFNKILEEMNSNLRINKATFYRLHFNNFRSVEFRRDKLSTIMSRNNLETVKSALEKLAEVPRYNLAFQLELQKEAEESLNELGVVQKTPRQLSGLSLNEQGQSYVVPDWLKQQMMQKSNQQDTIKW